MFIPDDDIARIEGEGVKLTERGDWAGARERFKEAFAFEGLSAERGARVILNIAKTYAMEGNLSAAAAEVQHALRRLDEGQVHAPELRGELHGLAAMWGGKSPVSKFWYALTFITGVLVGISIGSGVHIDSLTVWLAPPLTCFLIAYINWNMFNRVWFVTGGTLYTGYASGFAIGFAIALMGILRFAF